MPLKRKSFFIFVLLCFALRVTDLFDGDSLRPGRTLVTLDSVGFIGLNKLN